MEEKITAWVARDKNDSIKMYFYKPIKDEYWDVWRLNEYQDNFIKSFKQFSNDKFPQVKWEDEEPTKVELTIKFED